MLKIKHFLIMVCIAGCFAACKKIDAGAPYDPIPQFKADTTAIRAYVKANNIAVLKNEQYGVFYQIIAPGSGNIEYKTTTAISVDYDGKVMNGGLFDSSKGVTKSFILGNLIPGWQIGLPYIQKGGKIRLFIPSYYGYGDVARNAPESVIPANSVLDFTITLNDVSN
ncbi:FKBP-type peptidyl-prolyl cis-trans isomerase [Pedobacter aquatilis]|uniref:FKBP-type peptidyl-prolyl cis-trans isomerase n=1 Tax=Pedobacter aquatilis TaxID=351343 RepID=UPI0025B3D6BD|nr:FKBP-type peptidyl-prolyl cis-trans isomerase [Pedobacter aquatilis]MDN3585147.1 FKBP-type peptidyl-prolyl cis-trans isomerase [Pedobacter aquatilis]